MRENAPNSTPPGRAGREIDLIGYLLIIRKRALLILVIALTGLLTSLAASYRMDDKFQAKAVISPVKDGAPSGLSVLVQQMEMVPGMSLSSPSSAAEILALLNSGMLRRKAIENYGLLPLIFNDRWDEDKKSWSKGVEPTAHDALRAVDTAMSVRHSPKDNTITITFEGKDGQDAARFLEKLLLALNTHLSSEARRVAESNRHYLEGQLRYASDPLIRQNIYTLIAQQIESSMMAGVMENFAFKVIDPPSVPDRRVSPNRKLISVAGLFGALFIGVLVSFVLEFFDVRKHVRRD